MTDQTTYLPDDSFAKLRMTVAVNLLSDVLKDPNHTEAIAAASFLARVDEIACLEHGFYPESIMEPEAVA